MHFTGSGWHSKWRTDHLLVDLDTILQISQSSARPQPSEPNTQQHPTTPTSTLASRRRQRPNLNSPISSSCPSDGTRTLQSTPTTINTWSTETPRTEAFSSQATSPATLSQDAISPTPSSPDSPTTALSCLSCQKTFSGKPENAKSNLTRHLRTSPRHDKNQGLKCPFEDCRDKDRMRSDNLKPHLLTVHKIPSDQVPAIVDKCRASLSRVNSNGVPQRKSRKK